MSKIQDDHHRLVVWADCYSRDDEGLPVHQGPHRVYAVEGHDGEVRFVLVEEWNYQDGEWQGTHRRWTDAKPHVWFSEVTEDVLVHPETAWQGSKIQIKGLPPGEYIIHLRIDGNRLDPRALSPWGELPFPSLGNVRGRDDRLHHQPRSPPHPGLARPLPGGRSGSGDRGAVTRSDRAIARFGPLAEERLESDEAELHSVLALGAARLTAPGGSAR